MLSYARGPELPLLDETIFTVFARTVSRHPDADASIVPFQSVHLSFGALSAQVEQVAGALLAQGLSPGDRFGVWATNCAEWLLLQIAAARVGLVLVNVNPAYRSSELAYVLSKSRMRALFLHERDQYSDYRAILDQARASQPELALRSRCSAEGSGDKRGHRLLEYGGEDHRRRG